MTFRKKDPELVTLFLLHDGGANKTHQYRVVKRNDFVEALQVNIHVYLISFHAVKKCYMSIFYRKICRSSNEDGKYLI